MTPEQQRIAIAEVCGYKQYFDGTANRWTNMEGFGGVKFDELPDYLNDLNAIHEAEKLLTPTQIEKYADILCNAVAEDVLDPNISGLLFLTASQRAEAFLRTLNKWID